MTLLPDGDGSKITVDGEAVVPIPMFGSKIEAVVVEQVGKLFREQEEFTKTRLGSGTAGSAVTRPCHHDELWVTIIASC